MAGPAKQLGQTMGLQLREAIQASGRSLNELEKQAELARGQLSRFVHGKRDINFEAVSRLCDVLGIAFKLPKAAEKAPARKRRTE